MQFQEMPDSISMSLAKLQAAFPRFKLEAPTARLYRDHLRSYQDEAIERAVVWLIANTEKFPTIKELAAVCREHAAYSQEAQRSLLDPTPEQFEMLTLRERWMIEHAKKVIWRADYERREMRAIPPDLRGMDLNAEMLAHGIQIDQSGTKVRYDKNLIVNPRGCPAPQPRWDDTRSYDQIKADSQAAFLQRIESILERNAIRRAEVGT